MKKTIALAASLVMLATLTLPVFGQHRHSATEWEFLDRYGIEVSIYRVGLITPESRTHWRTGSLVRDMRGDVLLASDRFEVRYRIIFPSFDDAWKYARWVHRLVAIDVNNQWINVETWRGLGNYHVVRARRNGTVIIDVYYRNQNGGLVRYARGGRNTLNDSNVRPSANSQRFNDVFQYPVLRDAMQMLRNAGVAVYFDSSPFDDPFQPPPPNVFGLAASPSSRYPNGMVVLFTQNITRARFQDALPGEVRAAWFAKTLAHEYRHIVQFRNNMFPGGFVENINGLLITRLAIAESDADDFADAFIASYGWFIPSAAGFDANGHRIRTSTNMEHFMRVRSATGTASVRMYR